MTYMSVVLTFYHPTPGSTEVSNQASTDTEVGLVVTLVTSAYKGQASRLGLPIVRKKSTHLYVYSMYLICDVIYNSLLNECCSCWNLIK